MPDPLPAIEPDVPGRDGRSGCLLWVPYRKGLVADLKGCLPRNQRYRDEGIGAWWIDAREEEHAESIVLRHFASLVLLAGPGEEPTLLTGAGTEGSAAQTQGEPRMHPSRR